MKNNSLRFSSILNVLAVFWLFAFGQTAAAQVTNIEVVVDTAFYGPNTPNPEDTFDPDGILDGYVSYLVYVNMTNPTDVLSAVFADTFALPEGGALGIDAECECWNPIAESMVLDGTNSSFLWTIEPLWQYDTFWTIGKLSSDMPGDNPSWLSNPSVFGDAICGTEVTNGSAYVLGAPVNAVAGDDLRVLVARVTTCGDWSLNLNVQVFIEGDPDNEEQYFLNTDGTGPIQVTDPCQNYAEVEAQVAGAQLACAGLTTDVTVEFLGLDEAAEGTMYQLVTSMDGFMEDNQVLSETPVNAFPGLSEGEYRVYVTNDYGCMDTTAFTIEALSPIAATFSQPTNNECFGQELAGISLDLTSLSGGTGELTITGTRPDGTELVAQDLTDSLYWGGLICDDGNGAHTFNISDENGCVYDTIVNVNCPESFEVNFFSTDVVCAGDADGTISVDAVGGSGQLFLTNQFETVPVEEPLTGLGVATYVIQVVDSFGCTFPLGPGELIEISEPSALGANVGEVTNPSCGNDCDGEVALESFGGTGSLEVVYFNETTSQLFPDSTGLCAGDYEVTITDEAGCVLTAAFEIDAPAPLDFLISTTNATCTGMSDGSANIFPIGGTVSDQEYEVAYLDTAGNPVNLNNLSEMVYTAVMTDQVGCTYVETFEIGVDEVTDMELTTLTSPVTCWNAADGTATVSVSGGEAPFTFAWSDPYDQTSSTANGLTEDTYTVVVTDAKGCRRTASQEVEAIEGCLFIADALTPNNDGFNDDWVVGGLEDFPSSTLMVFNRWGQKLFETTGGQVRWDGRFNGARLPVADYYYAIELFPGALPIRGTVTLKY
ncbi:MAG: gliding motility-associated C-terminal domain-containing protein [Bacteroidota bacterium]|nr:gliding motility-associated C-terminal domain-containing protein [Bacteroidota bacterium]